jgi:hypothetical protein
VHLAGIAAVPLFLELTLLGLAASQAVLPNPLVVVLVAAAGIAPIFWMQWQRPFNIFSLVVLALKPNQLTETQRRILQLFKTPIEKVVTVAVALAALVILWQLNQWVPLVIPKASIVPGGGFAGLILAAVAFLFSNLFLQVPASTISVLLTPDTQLQLAEPYPVTQIPRDFTLLGLQVKQILPPVVSTPIAPAAPRSSASGKPPETPPKPPEKPPQTATASAKPFQQPLDEFLDEEADEESINPNSNISGAAAIETESVEAESIESESIETNVLNPELIDADLVSADTVSANTASSNSIDTDVSTTELEETDLANSIDTNTDPVLDPPVPVRAEQADLSSSSETVASEPTVEVTPEDALPAVEPATELETEQVTAAEETEADEFGDEFDADPSDLELADLELTESELAESEPDQQTPPSV